MGLGKLFWKLFLGNVLLMGLVVATCVWLIAHDLDHLLNNELTAQLRAQATILRESLHGRIEPLQAAELNRIVRQIADSQHNDTRITLILADGRVLADSLADATQMEPHDERKEVREALAGGWGEDTRLSRTVGRNMRYVARAVGSPDKPLGVVRVAMPLRTIGEHAGSVQRLIWRTGLLTLLAAALLALGLAQLWSLPIRRITLAARSLSRGDLSTRAKVSGTDELAVLARALNAMRDHLANQLETIDGQRRTLELLLQQLHEGVIVAGPNGRVVLSNPAAVRLLGLPAAADAGLGLAGRAVEECVRHHELQRMLLPAPCDEQADADDAVREVRIQPRDSSRELAVLARASNITLPALGRTADTTEPARTHTGRLLVITDITELTRLIQVRADFAANASHELRTPLSAIRAAVETLLQLDLSKEEDSARHFITVINRHSRRLEALVADLLELSRLESSKDDFQPADVDLRGMLADIRAQHVDAVTNKSLHWEESVPPELQRIKTNDHLLRIALDNLVDNAVKFTDPGGSIWITCQRVAPHGAFGPAVAITVADDGCGIPEGDLNRVFERFYQVERARSGNVLRGTGLGLSIVRHAVSAMHGSVEIKSELGRGTQITLTIPQ